MSVLVAVRQIYNRTVGGSLSAAADSIRAIIFTTTKMTD